MGKKIGDICGWGCAISIAAFFIVCGVGSVAILILAAKLACGVIF